MSAVTGPRATATNLAAAAALLVPGVLAFGPVFGGADGYVAAGGGVLLGLALAFAARRWRWALASTVAATVAAYLLFGGALALRRTTIAGFVPTPDTLLRLVPLSVQAWRDLLTVTPPAQAFVGPAVVPYLSGLVLALVAGWFALDARRHLWTLLPTLLLLVVGILWGLDAAPLAAWLGVGYGVVALAWAVWRRVEAGRAAGETILVGATSVRGDARRLGAAAGILLLGAAVALAASPVLGGGPERQVLRQVVQPPLDLTDYASPLTGYRYLEVDQKDVTLFTVAGLPAGGRVRLATLDAYDGRVYNVADASAGFVRIGERTGSRGPGTPATLDVTVTGYSGVWLPGGGDVRGVRFTGAGGAHQAETLYYNPYGGTLLSTAGVGEGTAYTVEVVLPGSERPTGTPALAGASEPALDRVPDVIGATATDFAGDAGTPIEQLRNLEKKLQEGFYSDGTDGKSRAGHTAERVASMLNAPMLIGDDEQYAVAMALMARQLGIPTRVVMGFYPDPKASPAPGPLAVKGTMAHVWVEVPFEGLGWVAFDPTPDRDRVPKTLVPKPKPNPRPQVLPPPEPPVNKAQEPEDDPGRKREEAEQPADDVLRRVLIGVAIGVGGAALVASPFVAIGALKARRRRLRRFADAPAARFSGGWAEVVDAATDLGTPVSGPGTRREASERLAAAYPGAGLPQLAATVDAAVFGAQPPTADAAGAAWSEVDRALGAMRAQSGRWQRFRAFCSLRSFRKGSR